MPTGIEEFTIALGGIAVEMGAAGAALSPFTGSPTSPGYADFEAQQSCNPPSDAELQDGSYADPGVCVCYEDQSGYATPDTSSSVDPAPSPVAGDRPPSQPKPAPLSLPAARLQKTGGAAPMAPSAPDAPGNPDPDSGPEPPEPPPLLEIDTRYLNLRLDFNPWQVFGPIPQGPLETNVTVKTNQIIRDVLDINPEADAPNLPGDEARAEIKGESGLGQTVLSTAAGILGAGGVSDALNDVILNMAEDESGLTTREEKMESERRNVESSAKLVVELLVVAVSAQKAAKQMSRKTAPERKSPTLSQRKKELEIYKNKLGQPTKDLGDVKVTRTTMKPDKPTGLGHTGPDEVTGIWHENKNVQIKVTSGAENPGNLKKVEIKVSEVQRQKPSPSKESDLYRRAIGEKGFIPKGKDKGHGVPRSVVAFEDPANYYPEKPTFNRHWKNLWVEAKSRKEIRAGNEKDSMTLKVIQEYSEGPGMEEVISTQHILTRQSDGKAVIDITLYAAGKVIDKSTQIP